MTDPGDYPPVDGTQPCAAEPEAFFPDAKIESDVSHTTGPDSEGWRRVAPSTREGYWSIQYALDLCAACPFRRPCLAYALVNDVIGIWGGTTYVERRQLRKEYGITARTIHMSDLELRDAEVARLDTQGLTTAQIAQRLQVTTTTVHTARARNRQTEGAPA